MTRISQVVQSASRIFRPAGPAAPPAGIAADLKKLFPEGAANVFDVGAYVGEFAALIHGAFPAARVWCFEPFPSSHERIRARFAGADWVTVHNLAVSDRNGSAELIVGPDQSTNSLVSPVVTNGAFAEGLPRVAVQVKTLADCALETLGPNAHLSILKVDTEGNDLRVLEGGEELLRSHRIEAIHIEVMFIEHFKSAPGYLDICHYLHQFGYRLYAFYDLKRNPQGQLRYGNALFLSPHRQEFAGIAR